MGVEPTTSRMQAECSPAELSARCVLRALRRVEVAPLGNTQRIPLVHAARSVAEKETRTVGRSADLVIRHVICAGRLATRIAHSRFLVPATSDLAVIMARLRFFERFHESISKSHRRTVTDGTGRGRTDYPLDAIEMLSQLSYSPRSSRWGSNPRPSACRADALPLSHWTRMVQEGIEPYLSSLIRRARTTSYFRTVG